MLRTQLISGPTRSPQDVVQAFSLLDGSGIAEEVLAKQTPYYLFEAIIKIKLNLIGTENRDEILYRQPSMQFAPLLLSTLLLCKLAFLLFFRFIF
jgi:hypothetical protein